VRGLVGAAVRGHSKFMTGHGEFLLYPQSSEWIVAPLSREAASVQVLSIQGKYRMYLVNMKDGSASAGNLAK
jgi:hypothetical protein